ncbi:MAG: hypothetical protein FD129_2059 [bacterium]|nr:MAG: hypothetical protein FD129_2059 [bacterium]
MLFVRPAVRTLTKYSPAATFWPSSAIPSQVAT